MHKEREESARLLPKLVANMADRPVILLRGSTLPFAASLDHHPRGLANGWQWKDATRNGRGRHRVRAMLPAGASRVGRSPATLEGRVYLPGTAMVPAAAGARRLRSAGSGE